MGITSCSFIWNVVFQTNLVIYKWQQPQRNISLQANEYNMNSLEERESYSQGHLHRPILEEEELLQ
jgi:hypothetical protein